MRFNDSSSTWALLGCFLGSQKYKVLALLMSVSIYDESKIGFNFYLPVDFLTNFLCPLTGLVVFLQYCMSTDDKK